MSRPASLGGNATPTAQVATSVVEADFIESYQEHLTRQWRCRVQLDGGRILENVGFMVPSSRVTAGSRPMMPAEGERVLLVYPASQRQIKSAYIIGSVDKYTYGPDHQHPDAAMQVHPSGQATLLDEEGNQVWRYPNGDTICQDDAEDETSKSNLRFFYRKHPAKVAELQENLPPSDGGRSRWFYDGRKRGTLFGAMLAEGDEKGESWVNRAKRTFATFVSRPGQKASLQASLDDGTLQLILDLQSRVAALELSQARAVLHADDTTLTLDGGGTAALEAKLKITTESNLFDLDAKVKAHVKSKFIHLDAPLNRAGGLTPVSTADAVDFNFNLIKMILRLPFLPTGTTSLTAKGAMTKV